MKARKVRGLDPDEEFATALARIAAVREEELRSFWPAARDPAAATALHDMRIAAKRLRYVLELGAPVLGDGARRRAREARELQALLGEIHDCDEILPVVEDHEALAERFRARRERCHREFLDTWRRMEA